MPDIKVIEGDITLLKVDAIVNSADRTLLGISGLDQSVHKAAGPRLREKCLTLGGCKTGEAKLTRGYDLPAVYIIHTAGPFWQGGQGGEEKLLKNCYVNCLKIAEEEALQAIAFPCISTGANHFPPPIAANIAVKTVKDFFANKHTTSIKAVFFVCYNPVHLRLYQALLNLI